MELFRQITNEINNYEAKQIQIVPGFSFNQKTTIDQIYFYYNSKFQTGDIDEDGDRKYFYNINKNPCKIFSKAIDFDTKNIRMLTTGGGDPLKTWFMERDLKYWMNTQQFGKVLNKIFHDLPIYGTVVLKIVDGKPYFVDLRNFIVDQSAESIDSMNFKIEIHYLTVIEFRKIGKQMGWPQDKIDLVITEFRKMKDTSHIRLYERYGDVEADDGTWSYQRTFVADVGIDTFDEQTQKRIEHPGVQLESKEWDGHPYWEFHAEKMGGRWLGIGVVETLFEPQIRENELTNVQAKSTYWAGLRVFQSRDPAINKNLYTDTKNGEIMSVDSEITPVDMADRNLSFFNEEHARWRANIDSLTVAFAPVGHSVIAIQVAQDQVISYFEQIQENIAMDIKEMIYDVIIPQFEKDSSPEHILRLVGKDLDTYIEMVKNQLVAEEVVKLAIKSITTGKFPSNHDRDVIGIAIEQSIRQGKEKLLTIPKNFYSDARYDIDIDITGESVDVKTRYATKFALLQAMTADPTMLTDPVKRKFLFSMAEDGGLNPNDFFETPTLLPEAVNPQGVSQNAGGGVSAPPMGARMPGKSVATV